MRKVLVVHYDEIALKGKNRGYFEDRLLHGIQNLFRDVGGIAVRKLYGRFLVSLEKVSLPEADVVLRLTRLPGLRYLLEGRETDGAWESLLAAVDEVLPPEGAARTFGVRAKRADKNYPKRSAEIEREMGGHVLAQRAWTVDLGDPDVWIRIELVNGRGLVCTHRHEGPGGLPTGVSGRGLALLSGGIDSPVAAFMMMTRGLTVSCIHFHSAPYTNERSQDKVRDLARLLVRFQPTLDLTMVPFAEPIQQSIVRDAPQALRVILYRRFMVRLANRAAVEARAACIISGESLGQVASQTIENLTSVQAVSGLPILRPLIGRSKSEIIGVARRIETYETSILPHDDCCSYLMPRSPATRSTPAELEVAERVLDVDALVDAAWEKRDRETLRL